MRFCFLIISILLYTSLSSFSQDTISKKNNTVVKGISSGQNDSIAKIKMDEYKEMLKKADKYEVRTEKELKNINYYKAEAEFFLDSALKVSKIAEIDKSNAKLYLMEFNYLYNQCSLMTNRVDSVYKIAQLFKDTANRLNNDAELFYLTIPEVNNPVVNKDSTKSEIFVIQLGAGYIEKDLLKKAGNDLEVITPSDGIKRYIVGKYLKKETALENCQKMIELGFVDAFIRTLSSLNY